MKQLAVVVGAVVSLLAACNSKSHATADARSPDAPIDAPKSAIALMVFGSPQLLVYRDGDGPWLVPPSTGSGSAGGTNYSLSVTNDYEVLAVCTQGSAFDAELTGATVADGSTQSAFCSAPTAPTPPTTVAVTGTLVQAGTVDMYDTMTGSTANWTFTLNVPTGMHDLVAYDPTSVLIHRGENVTGAMSLGSFNLSTSGSAWVNEPMTVTNAGSGMVTSLALWGTANDLASWTGTGSAIQLPPTALVDTTTDAEGLSVSVADTTTSQDVSEFFTGTPSTLTFALPAAFTGVLFDTTTPELAVSWQTEPTYQQLSLFVGSETSLVDTDITVTPSWVAATHTTKLTYDVSPAPSGYNSAWAISTSSAIFANLSANSSSPDGSMSYSSSYATTFNTALRPAPTQQRQWQQLQRQLQRYRQR